MRLVGLAVGIMMAAAPAAAEPAYVGLWSETSDPKCSEPLRITEREVEPAAGNTWTCELPKPKPGAVAWSMHMRCAQEGEEYTQFQRWAMEGQTLVISTMQGDSVYRRCPAGRAK